MGGLSAPRQDASDVGRLADDLRALGVCAEHLLVHCSLGRVGTDEPTLFAALREAQGAGPTLVVPTLTEENSHSSGRYLRATAALGPRQRAAYHARMPGFTTDTPTWIRFSEYVRRLPGSVRSGHPQTSFAANGPDAARFMAVHELESHLGERSPLAALYDAGAYTLLLGVGYDACTAAHLAEYRLVPPPPERPYRCYVQRDGRRVQLDFMAAHLDDDDFPALGEALDKQPFVRTGRVGGAVARLLPINELVDFAVGWMSQHRRP